jgi:hypothetical protein
MPKFKRELVPGAYLTAADMLHTLSQQQLVAAALESTIVLAADPAVAWLLDRCCVGRPVPTAAATDDSNGVSNSSNTSSMARLAAAAAAAGVNRASQEVLLQFEQHQAQLLARRQRRARRTPGFITAAGIMAPAATPGQPAAAAAGAMSASAQDLSVQQDDDASTAAEVAAGVGEIGVAVNGGDDANGWPVDSTSGSGVGLPLSIEELGQLQLVQLSCQEAFFLAHVLKCCSVFTVQQDALQAHQQQQQQLVLRVEQPQAPEQQQQQQQRLKGPLTPAELWRWCCASAPGGAPQFVSRYAAYKHFRCKGWLPLPGLLYGADYVLYKLHPEWAHSDFLVLVMVERPTAAAAGAAGVAGLAAAGAADVTAGRSIQQQEQVMAGKGTGSEGFEEQQQLGLQVGLAGISGASSRTEGSTGGSTQLTWLDAHIMQRLARQVLKQLLLLYVVIPPGLELGSLECMQQLTVREVLLQRWVPSEHREDGKA